MGQKCHPLQPVHITLRTTVHSMCLICEDPHKCSKPCDALGSPVPATVPQLAPTDLPLYSHHHNSITPTLTLIQQQGERHICITISQLTQTVCSHRRQPHNNSCKTTLAISEPTCTAHPQGSPADQEKSPSDATAHIHTAAQVTHKYQ